MGQCYALVKRTVHESLGLVAPLEGSLLHPPRIDPPVILDMLLTFVDDGIIAGDEQEVLRAIQHMKRAMQLVGIRFFFDASGCGGFCNPGPRNFQTFRDEGCTAEESCTCTVCSWCVCCFGDLHDSSKVAHLGELWRVDDLVDGSKIFHRDQC